MEHMEQFQPAASESEAVLEEVTSKQEQSSAPEQEAVAKLREMGSAAYLERCRQVAERISGYVKDNAAQIQQDIRDTYLSPEMISSQGRDENRYNNFATYVANNLIELQRYEPGDFEELDALEVLEATHKYAQYPVSLVGGKASIGTPFYGTRRDRINNAVGHIFPISGLLWSYIHEQLSPEDQEFVRLAEQKGRIGRVIGNYNSARRSLEKSGIDPENPELFNSAEPSTEAENHY